MRPNPIMKILCILLDSLQGIIISIPIIILSVSLLPFPLIDILCRVGGVVVWWRERWARFLVGQVYIVEQVYNHIFQFNGSRMRTPKSQAHLAGPPHPVPGLQPDAPLRRDVAFLDYYLRSRTPLHGQCTRFPYPQNVSKIVFAVHNYFSVEFGGDEFFMLDKMIRVRHVPNSVHQPQASFLLGSGQEHRIPGVHGADPRL